MPHMFNKVSAEDLYCTIVMILCSGVKPSPPVYNGIRLRGTFHTERQSCLSESVPSTPPTRHIDGVGTNIDSGSRDHHHDATNEMIQTKLCQLLSCMCLPLTEAMGIGLDKLDM
jgi:hypothetical protein